MASADEKLLPQAFAENGCANGMFGKWHLEVTLPNMVGDGIL